MLVGKVKWFNDAKGYGFIQTGDGDNGERYIFVHYTEIDKQGFKSLAEGQSVRFELADTPKGLQAKNVAPADATA